MAKYCTNLYGIFSWFGFELPMPQRLSLIKQAGFTTTSLWWDKAEGLTNKNEKKKLIEQVRDSGLYLENIHVPFENCNGLWSSDRDVCEKVIRGHICWLEDCARYAIPIMVMHLTKGSDLPDPTKEGIESLVCLLKTAEELNIRIAIENTRRPDYLDCVFSKLDSPHLGFCYDSSHDWLYGKPKTEILKKWGHRLAAVHLSDNDGQEDGHWLPGEGIVDWSAVCDSLPWSSYSGCVTLEVFPRQGNHKESPENFLRQAYEKLQWLKKICGKG
jgi:sugar phosphate isomerase/epimerase